MKQKTSIKVNGKDVPVKTIEQSDGTWGYYTVVGMSSMLLLKIN